MLFFFFKQKTAYDILSGLVGSKMCRRDSLKTITLAPGYQSNETHIVLAEELYEEKAYGDEPEPLEIVAHKLSDLEKLTYSEDLTEARSILALYMVRDIIRSR